MNIIAPECIDCEERCCYECPFSGFTDISVWFGTDEEGEV